MRYYDLDANGWPRSSYARPQPDKDLQHLPDQPSEHHRWDGEQWIEDTTSVNAEWYERIEQRADTELGKGVSYTASDGVAYTIRTGPSARSLISGAHSATERADRLGNAITRKVPTQNSGVVAFGNADLVGIFEAVENRHQAVMDRVEELHAKVADGTMEESDLSSGWP